MPPQPLIDLSLSVPARLRAGLRSWIRQERRSLPTRTAVTGALLSSLLLLSPLLALELLRRSTVIRHAQRLAREEALELLHAAQEALRRTTRDWAQWDDTYAFVTGRNPDYVGRQLSPSPIFDDGTVMLIFERRGRLLLSHGAPGRSQSDDRSLKDCARSNLPRQNEPANAKAITTMVPLLCRSGDGTFFLGIADPITDSQAVSPPQGTLVLLSPLLRSDYGPHLVSSLRHLERDLIVLPAVAPGQQPPSPSAIEAVTGNRLYTSEGRRFSLRSQGVWLELSRSLAEQSLLLLSLLLLLLSFRARLLLDRRRQLLLQRRQEIQANRRIRHLCQELDDLLQQIDVDTAQASPDARVLARLIGRDDPGASSPCGALAAHHRQAASQPGSTARGPVSDDARVAERMRRITERFQSFLGSARRLALCDSLTQLPNRRYFLEYLNLEAERQRALQGRFAVLFVDIDKFKAINDTYGHAVGDQALVAVAERLRGLMRAGDFLARYGGDEFVVMMPLKPAAAREESELRSDVFGFASRIASGFESSMRFESASLEINLSIGVAMVNPAEINPEEAIQRSDEAMYRAKLHKTSRIAIFSIDDEVLPQGHPAH